MNKNAIKKFAIDARNKLIASVTDKAGMLGITAKECSKPISKGPDFEIYKTSAGTEVTLDRHQIDQRRKLENQINSRGFEAVVEEIAYTWFNRICAIRFMEVNDYLPVRVLSSSKPGKTEPDLVTYAPDVELEFNDEEKSFILEAKLANNLDALFQMLFVKQCHALNEILPELFEETADYMELLLNISFTNKDDVVRMLIDGVSEKDFNVTTPDENGELTGQVEIIGWLYQYYNTELKDDTFAKLKKNVKITKERIPAATQLFTPDWIVRYMVENSVGRLWIEHLRAMDSSIDEEQTAKNFGWKYYLSEAEQEDIVNVKLAEIRTEYENLRPEDITCIDPCMGSGHILIAMFDVLMDIYKSAGYSEREAAFCIIENNIHGLDIDKRAYQLAYFAVMMKGRGYNRRFFRGRDGQKILPKVYAFSESNEIERKHLKYFGANLSASERSTALKQISNMLDQMKNARELGSILKLQRYDWEILNRFVDTISIDAQYNIETVGIDLTQRDIRKLIKLAQLLSHTYCICCTNPPYLGVSFCDSTVNNYVKANYFETKTDMFAVFMVRCSDFVANHGIYAMITQHSWMFLKSFKCIREHVAHNSLINMAHLGARAFEEIAGEVVQTTAFSIMKGRIKKYKGQYIRLVNYNSQISKEEAFLKKSNQYIISSEAFDFIEDSPVAYWVPQKLFDIFHTAKQIGDFGDARVGMQTGENDKFVRLWEEIDYRSLCIDANSLESAQKSRKKWFPYNKGGEYRKWYGNNDWVVDWYNDGQNIKEDKLYKLSIGKCLPSNSKPKNVQYYFRKSITWSKVSSGSIAFRFKPEGHIFDIAGASIFTSDDMIRYLQGYCNSVVAMFIAFVLSPTINYEAGTVSKFPVVIDNERKSIVEKLVEECVSISKKDYDTYETSWDFEGHILTLLGKRSIKEAFSDWKNISMARVQQLRKNEESLNKIFMDIYGLNDELSYEVNESNVTIHKADLQTDIKSLISYAVGCMFGRYSLDESGIILAGGEFNECRYKTFCPDNDNIIPITEEEYFDDDIVGRFVSWIKAVYGEEYLEENLDYIAYALGYKGNSSRDIIRYYFLNDFFKDHCTVYSTSGSGKRPIYWLFDSGKQNGFKCLIYLHRYTPDTVGIMRTEYLHKTQNAIEQAMMTATRIMENSDKATEKSQATKRIAKYTKQLEEIRQYDEAMAHVANQRISIDLDDGVKVNYAKFQGIEVAQEGKKTQKIDLLAKI